MSVHRGCPLRDPSVENIGDKAKTEVPDRESGTTALPAVMAIVPGSQAPVGENQVGSSLRRRRSDRRRAQADRTPAGGGRGAWHRPAAGVAVPGMSTSRFASTRLQDIAVVANEISTVDPDRDWRAGIGRIRGSRLLSVDVHIRFAPARD